MLAEHFQGAQASWPSPSCQPGEVAGEPRGSERAGGLPRARAWQHQDGSPDSQLQGLGSSSLAPDAATDAAMTLSPGLGLPLPSGVYVLHNVGQEMMGV